MLEELKKWWEDLKSKLGDTIIADKNTEIENALKELAALIEKKSENKEGKPKPDDKLDVTKISDELGKKIKEALGIKDINSQTQDPKPNMLDADAIAKALTAAMEPVTKLVTDLKKQTEDMAKLYQDKEKESVNLKVQELLQGSYKKGKFSSAEIAFYKEQLEKNYEVAKNIIEKLPENAIVAKQNTKSAFTLDSKPVELKTPTEEEKKKNIAKTFDISWAQSVNPDDLNRVMENIEN